MAKIIALLLPSYIICSKACNDGYLWYTTKNLFKPPREEYWLYHYKLWQRLLHYRYHYTPYAVGLITMAIYEIQTKNLFKPPNEKYWSHCKLWQRLLHCCYHHTLYAVKPVTMAICDIQPRTYSNHRERSTDPITINFGKDYCTVAAVTHCIYARIFMNDQG